MTLQANSQLAFIRSILISIGLFISAASIAQVDVTFSGKILMHADDHAPVTMTITSATDTTVIEIPSSGRFKFTVVENDSVSVTVSCPGFISKQIIIDTFHAAGIEGTSQKIEFDVMLEHQPEEKEMIYNGPVGMVKFAKRTSSGRPLYVYTPQSKTELIEASLTAAR